MTTIQSGEFWVANITYTDSSSTKKHPVIISPEDAQVILQTWDLYVKPQF
jgi:hypothetical protein